MLLYFIVAVATEIHNRIKFLHEWWKRVMIVLSVIELSITLWLTFALTTAQSFKETKPTE